MNRLKRAAALFLALALLALPAAAAEAGAAERAATLHSLGLFQGVIPGRFDEESMALDKSATRAEALVMFMRLMGNETAALEAQAQHPFSDVDPWAAPYVGYAWQGGVVKGQPGGLFGFGRIVTLNEYVTFVLRALGYSDGENGDFTWNTAAAYGEAVGLYGSDFAARCADGMTRGDLVQVSYAALSLPVKDGSCTLAGYLLSSGAVEDGAFDGLGIPLTPDPAEEGPLPQEDTTRAQIERVVELVNEARAAEGLGPLVLDERLTDLAAIRAVEICDQFSHTRPDGRDCFSVMSDDKYVYNSAGENIAAGQSTPEIVVEAWLNSPGHRANILGAQYGRIGVGVVNRRWVQLFSD